MLIYTRATDHPQIERTDGSTDNPQTFQLGPGSSPYRASNKNGVVAILRTPNGYEIVTYRNDPTRLLFPAIHMPDYVSAVTWQSGNFVSNLMSYLTKVNLTVPEALLQTEDFNPDATSGLVDQVYIANLNAPQPYLADSVNDRFTLMREQLNLELGWDFLGILQSAFNPLPSDTQADIKDDWSYTGRAIAVNLDPLDAGWMTVSREDYNGRTYWRVWLKCQAQDGTCGAPIKEPVWDFNARYTNPSGSYEMAVIQAPFRKVTGWISLRSHFVTVGSVCPLNPTGEVIFLQQILSASYSRMVSLGNRQCSRFTPQNSSRCFR